MYYSYFSAFAPLLKDQRSFYKIGSLAMCINNKAFNHFNRKQLNILKTFLNIWNLIMLLSEDDFASNITEQIMFGGLVTYKPILANICWSWRRLQHVFSVTIFRLWRRLEDVSKMSCRDVLRTSWGHHAKRLENVYEDVLEDENFLCWRRLQDILKTCLEDVLKRCLKDVLETYLEGVLKASLYHVLKTSWRQTRCFLGISVSNKSIFHNSTISYKSKVNPKSLTRTQ